MRVAPTNQATIMAVQEGSSHESLMEGIDHIYIYLKAKKISSEKALVEETTVLMTKLKFIICASHTPALNAKNLEEPIHLRFKGSQLDNHTKDLLISWSIYRV